MLLDLTLTIATPAITTRSFAIAIVTPMNNPQIRHALLVRPRELERPTVHTATPAQPTRRTPEFMKTAGKIARKIAG
ncbi:hypothetical protein AAEX63_01315 [Luteococcus sp. H138]|uniref:hypothetical protein n=1 Tax=unclassified Luteococcus TaxID=2639923 RepID=UPI00313E30A1